MVLQTRESYATAEDSREGKRTKMTKQDWEEQQRRNLRNLEFRMKFPPDNYQTITKSY